MDKQMTPDEVLAALKSVVRIAKAASVGVTGNGPRIEKAEQAIAAVPRMQLLRRDQGSRRVALITTRAA